MSNMTQTTTYHAVICPSCGLLCDDLTIVRDAEGKLSVLDHGCAQSAALFGHAPQTLSPRIDGQSTTLEAAMARTVHILKYSRQPLFAGLGTDVQGMRAVLTLADKCGATVDHMNSNAFMRNIQAMQNSGWQVTTLTEVRHRMDLLLILATDIVSAYPNFFKRVVWNKESMFGQDTASRKIVYLGGHGIDTSPGISPDGREPDVLPCELERLPEAVMALRALVSGKTLALADIAGIAIGDLMKLADMLKVAKYSVITWMASTLNFPHAELTVQNIAQLVMTLNETTRSACLPLGGNDGEATANQVSTWASGFPMRVSYARGYPEYDPYHFATDRLLACGETDMLLWVSCFDPERTPPRTASLPTVVFGHPNMQFAQEPTVFIPVGVPGVDHNGIVFRGDGMTALPLTKLRDSSLPNLALLLTSLTQAL